jgi:hypothetical protein
MTNRWNLRLLLIALLLASTSGLSAAGPVRVGDAEPYRIETDHPYAGSTGEAGWRRVVHWADAS